MFGDSLSDVGNDSLATGGTVPPSAIYYQGRFSNGPNWVDTLAKYLGEPAVQPSLAGGLDFAFGGATVAASPVPPFTSVPTLAQQIGLYELAGHTPAANDVFAVWGGANDFFDTFSLSTGPISPFASADAVESSLETLAGLGARQFVVPNLPLLGATPYVQAIQGFGVPGLVAGANAWTTAFNAELSFDLGKLQSDFPTAKIAAVDVAGLFQQILGNPSSFGFVNTTDPTGPIGLPGSALLTSTPTVSDPQHYLFFDGVHPTSKGQQLIGVHAAADVESALGINAHVVTSTADIVDPMMSGLSLRELVNLTNLMPGQQTITFNLGAGPHTIQLSGQDLPIAGDLVLNGPNNGPLTISGAGQSRIFEVASGAHATISNLILSNGSANVGGAISNAGWLQLDFTTFLRNTAQQGGAIYNTGTLSVNDSLLIGNTAVSSSLAAGGAIANSGASASASLFGTAIVDNTAQGGTLAEGGGIANLSGAQLTVSFSVIAVNSAEGVTGQGGGIFTDATSKSSLVASLVIGNYASTRGWNIYKGT